MEYRKLGKTGMDVSVIGLGCEHLDRKPYGQVKETIDAALAGGVNIIDVFMPGAEVRGNIAKALGGRRSGVLVQGHIGSTDLNQQYDISRDMPTVKKYFEGMLRLFGGYIDLGMMFFIDSEEDYKNVFETGFVTYAEALKKQGDILHIGFSSHNPEMAIRAVETGVPEMMMFSINPAFDMLPADAYIFDHIEKGFGAGLFRGVDPKRARLYKLCEQRQVGVTVMKALGSGKLLKKEFTPFQAPLSVAQCVSYALSRPAVCSALVGCQTAGEVACALGYLACGEAEKDYSAIINGIRNDFWGNCVYCNHCRPCPAGIDIAAVNKYLDVALLDESAVPPSIRTHYRSLEKNGSDCVGCGSCEKRCPFGVPVSANMAKAEGLLG